MNHINSNQVIEQRPTMNHINNIISNRRMPALTIRLKTPTYCYPVSQYPKCYKTFKSLTEEEEAEEGGRRGRGDEDNEGEKQDNRQQQHHDHLQQQQQQIRSKTACASMFEDTWQKILQSRLCGSGTVIALKTRGRRKKVHLL